MVQGANVSTATPLARGLCAVNDYLTSFRREATSTAHCDNPSRATMPRQLGLKDDNFDFRLSRAQRTANIVPFIFSVTKD